MRYIGSKLSLGIAVLVGMTTLAHAQMTPGPMGGGGMGGPSTPAGDE